MLIDCCFLSTGKTLSGEGSGKNGERDAGDERTIEKEQGEE